MMKKVSYVLSHVAVSGVFEDPKSNRNIEYSGVRLFVGHAPRVGAPLSYCAVYKARPDMPLPDSSVPVELVVDKFGRVAAWFEINDDED